MELVDLELDVRKQPFLEYTEIKDLLIRKKDGEWHSIYFKVTVDSKGQHDPEDEEDISPFYPIKENIPKAFAKLMHVLNLEH